MSSSRAYLKLTDGRLHQGDIFSDITIIEDVSRDGEQLSIEERKLPYGIIFTQECDLDQDFKSRAESAAQTHDKYLPSILLCPAYPAEQFRLGTHLEEHGQKMQDFKSSSMFKSLKQNNLYRYHFISADLDHNVPDLVIDFKHYFTIKRNIAYSASFKKGYITTITYLFREFLSSRFCYYLSRIGLPEIPIEPTQSTEAASQS